MQSGSYRMTERERPQELSSIGDICARKSNKKLLYKKFLVSLHDNNRHADQSLSGELSR